MSKKKPDPPRNPFSKQIPFSQSLAGVAQRLLERIQGSLWQETRDSARKMTLPELNAWSDRFKRLGYQAGKEVEEVESLIGETEPGSDVLDYLEYWRKEAQDNFIRRAAIDELIKYRTRSGFLGDAVGTWDEVQEEVEAADAEQGSLSQERYDYETISRWLTPNKRKEIERNQEILVEFTQRRKEGERATDLFNSLADKHGLTPSRVEDIVYPYK